MSLRLELATLLLLTAVPSQAALPEFPFRLPDRLDWWRREVPRGRPVDPELEVSLGVAFAALPPREWGRALADSGRRSLWDVGLDEGGLRYVGFRGNRSFRQGEDPGEWEGSSGQPGHGKDPDDRRLAGVPAAKELCLWIRRFPRRPNREDERGFSRVNP